MPPLSHMNLSRPTSQRRPQPSVLMRILGMRLRRPTAMTARSRRRCWSTFSSQRLKVAAFLPTCAPRSCGACPRGWQNWKLTWLPSHQLWLLFKASTGLNLCVFSKPRLCNVSTQGIAHAQLAQLLASEDFPRLREKVEGLIKEFGALQDRLQNSYTKGLVDGFDRPLVPQWLLEVATK